MIAFAVCLLAALSAQVGPPKVKMADLSKAHRIVERGGDALSKLTPELRALYQQYSPSKRRITYSPSQLESRFGILGAETNPMIRVVVRGDVASLQKLGFTSTSGPYGMCRVLDLERIAADEACTRIDAVRPARMPEPGKPKQFRIQVPTARGDEPEPGSFDHQGLTGKGVIIGVIDTGIDWKHKDFIRPDGTSRILALYDMWDDTWDESKGAVGSKPPMEYKDRPLGTLYTNAQINAALKGTGKVNSRDIIGHGTACAGAAAGNGSATANGVDASTYAGVAPEADLIIVKTFRDSGTVFVDYHTAAKWIMDESAKLGKPCVVNMSLGGHDSAHDGNAAEEVFLNGLVGDGKPGRIICVAAGNEGKDSFHAAGTFGPKREGQGDIESDPIELIISEKTEINAYFDSRDDWGLAVVGNGDFLVDPAGKELCLSLSYTNNPRQLLGSVTVAGTGDEYKGDLWKTQPPGNAPKTFTEYFDKGDAISAAPAEGAQDRLRVTLYPGRYYVFGYGASEKVPKGKFDIYIPFTSEGSFGKGVDLTDTIGSPGNASNVITVGSYDFRDKWANVQGKETAYNMTLGQVSEFSSQGYRRDGHVKPDICAPGRYAISSLADGSKMSRDPARVTKDGFHLAWEGTSAATPYATGVIALMLEANPGLDARQIQSILKETRLRDPFTEPTPNPRWGQGKLDPVKAIKEAKARSK